MSMSSREDETREVREAVVCPECATPGSVALHRREASDFCAGCDYPLFWTPSVVIRDQGAGSVDGLRRLPGTGGRQTVAAVPCPTCAEANPISAVTCLRCAGPMLLPAAPVVVPVVTPAPPVAVTEPARKPFPWWWLVGGVVTALVLIALIIMLVVG